ncbi:MAG: hypothetical protein WCK41_11045 [Actinomycetes bacterium]
MDETSDTVGALLGRCLATLGARRVFAAAPVDSTSLRTDLGLAIHATGDADLAALLAAADGRIGPGPGVAVLGANRVLVTSAPGVEPDVVRVSDPSYLPGALGGWTLGGVHESVVFELDLDLEAPAPEGLEPIVLDASNDELLMLSPTLADFRLVILAGPGIARMGHVAGLRALASSAGCGVINTWGAKGVTEWDDLHHFGTIGLQARDVELSGLADAELVITCGVDEVELPPQRWIGSAQVLEVEPWQLSSLAHHWPDPGPVPVRPPLFGQLADALGESYRSDAVPLTPARAVADLGTVLPPGGLIAGDPGPAGLWLARAFRTVEPGSVIVPAAFVRGFAAAATLVASLSGRVAIGVTTEPKDSATEAIVDLATSWSRPLVLEIWGGDESMTTVGDHARRLRDALDKRGVHCLDVPVDFAETRRIIEVAGEVVAWHSDDGSG